MSRLSQLRMARYDGREDERQSNEDGQGCTDIVNEWKSFNTSGDKAVPGVGDDVDEKETNNTITSLNKLNSKLVFYRLFLAKDCFMFIVLTWKQILAPVPRKVLAKMSPSHSASSR